MAGLGPASGNARLEAESSAPAAVAALAHRSRNGTELWLANLTPETRKVKVTGLTGAVELHRLSEGQFQKLAADPGFLTRPAEKLKKLAGVELGPYEVARLRGGVSA